MKYNPTCFPFFLFLFFFREILLVFLVGHLYYVCYAFFLKVSSSSHRSTRGVQIHDMYYDFHRDGYNIFQVFNTSKLSVGVKKTLTVFLKVEYQTRSSYWGDTRINIWSFNMNGCFINIWICINQSFNLTVSNRRKKWQKWLNQIIIRIINHNSK